MPSKIKRTRVYADIDRYHLIVRPPEQEQWAPGAFSRKWGSPVFFLIPRYGRYQVVEGFVTSKDTVADFPIRQQAVTWIRDTLLAWEVEASLAG